VDAVLKSPADAGDVGRDLQDAGIAFFQQIRRAGSRRTTTPGSGDGITTRTGGLVGDGVALAERLIHYAVQTDVRIEPRR